MLYANLFPPTLQFLQTASLIIHVAAGALTLLAGPVAIFYNFKNPHRHRQAGKVFFYAMLVVCASAVAGYLKRPDQVFFQFLLGIAAIVLATVVRGVRAIHLMKGGRVIPLDFGYQVLLGITGLVMLGMAGWYWRLNAPMALVILFGVFGLASFTDGVGMIGKFFHPKRMHSLDWYRLHIGSMLGAFTASTTAFTVNAAPFLPWYLQWFGPTLLLVPLQIYFGRMIKNRKKQELNRLQPVSLCE